MWDGKWLQTIEACIFVILYDFTTFYRPFAAKCPSAVAFSSAENMSADFVEHVLLCFCPCSLILGSPDVLYRFFCFLLAFNQVGMITCVPYYMMLLWNCWIREPETGSIRCEPWFFFFKCQVLSRPQLPYGPHSSRNDIRRIVRERQHFKVWGNRWFHLSQSQPWHSKNAWRRNHDHG